MIRIKKVTYYTFEVEDVKYELCFQPIKDLPGFSHRVLIINPVTRTLIKKDWLGEGFKPSRKAAYYYAAKHFDPDYNARDEFSQKNIDLSNTIDH